MGLSRVKDRAATQWVVPNAASPQEIQNLYSRAEAGRSRSEVKLNDFLGRIVF